MYNILMACDNQYYNQWAINCINSIKQRNPWISIHVVIANPSNEIKKIKDINYYYETIQFPNTNCEIAYYQALRFLKVPEIFSNNELVMTLDCDTICTRSFSIQEFTDICKTIHVQRHQKADKWMAGLVTYGSNSAFRNDFKTNLLAEPLDKWRYGRDQDVLNLLSRNHNFQKLNVGQWMSFGKGKGIFITLKGTQKTKDKFLKNYSDAVRKNESIRT